MKFRFALMILGASLLTGLTGNPARAQSDAPLPPPPAMAIAARMTQQAEAAQRYAAVLRAKNDPSAAFQDEIAHRRAFQAARKYQEVVSSATYRHTSYAPDALYKEAHVQETYLHNKDAAIQSLKNLANNYGGVAFPEKVAAEAERARLEAEIDDTNRTKPPGSILYHIMDTLVKLTGSKSYSYVIAIVLISVLIKLALTPLSNKQYASMKETQKLQPIIKEIQAKYKDDKEAQGRKMMEVYKEHNVNPAAGCVPLLAQMPILIGLYQMIRLYQYQFAHGTFLWIGSGLSHQYPAFLASDLGQQDIPLLLLYAFSMYVQQKMMVSPDPQQAEQQKMMALMTPFLSTYMFLQWHLPSAFILYYLVFNILSMAQQWYYMKRGNDPKKTLAVISGPTAADLKLTEAPYLKATNGNGSRPTPSNVVVPQKTHPKKKRR